MRTPILFVSALVLALASGCKGKPTVDNAPATDPNPQATPATGGSAAALPAGPVRKTTVALTTPDFDRLEALKFPGYKARKREENASLVDFRHISEGHPKIAGIVRINPCKDCVPMELAKWQAQSDKLKQELPDVIRDRPELKFEIGEATVNGVKMIAQYALDVSWTGEKEGSNIGGYIDAYTLHYNDGINEITVVAAYADDSPGTEADLVKMAPRDKLEKFAAQMMTAYTAAW